MAARVWVLASLAAVAVTVWACGDGDNGPTSSPSTPPSVVSPGEFPNGLVEFAGRLDTALVQGTHAFFGKSELWRDYDCEGNYFPAPGPNCVEAPEGEGVKAIKIGAYQSEGDVYDGPSYGRYMAGWMYDLAEGESDEYGEALPRAYAIADLAAEYEPEQGPGGTYEVIATRIANGADVESSRQALMFYVTGAPEGWLITGLQRVPTAFLDPESDEAQELGIKDGLVAWQRWGEPAPSPGERNRWSGQTGLREVAYVEAPGGLFVTTADGSEVRTVAQGVCAESGLVKESAIEWSPRRDYIAAFCGYDEDTPAASLEVYGVEAGAKLATITGLSSYEWSWDGQSIAYQEANADPPRVHRYVVATGDDSVLHEDALLLAWPDADRVLLGLHPQRDEGGVFIYETFEAIFYDVTTGAEERIPRFDDHAQFWTVRTNPARQAVVLSGHAQRKEGGAILGVYDFATATEAPFDSAVIGYGSEGIPFWMVAPGVEHLMWADMVGTGTAVSLGLLDGSEFSLLDNVAGLGFDLSPDGLVLYWPHGEPRRIVVRDAHTGAETDLGEVADAAIAPIAQAVS